MRGRVVLDELARGPRSMRQIMAATGWSASAVSGAISRLNGAGFVIVNLVPHRHDGALYRLLYDPRHPHARHCAWLGCATRLNSYNPGPLCGPHRREAARFWLARLDVALDGFTFPREVMHEQEGQRHKASGLAVG